MGVSFVCGTEQHKIIARTQKRNMWVVQKCIYNMMHTYAAYIDAQAFFMRVGVVS